MDKSIIHRGTLYANNFPNVTEGVGLSSEERKINGVALQTAIYTAAKDNKRFEIDAGIYEIDLPGGLIIPESYSGFEWRGSRKGGNGSTKIVQFANNTPVMKCGANGDNSYTVHIDGVELSYGNDQSNYSGSYALHIGQTWRSTFRYISTTGNCYIGCLIEGGGFYFQNTMEHCYFRHGTKHALAIQNFGTGNVWRDLYLGGGAPNAKSITGSLLYMFDNYGSQDESVFEQVNLEWAKCQRVMTLNTVRNATFISTHFEGNILSGGDPSLIYSENCQLQFVGLKLLDNEIKASNVAGVPSIIRDGFNSNIDVSGFGLTWTKNIVDTDFPVFAQNNYYKHERPTMLNIRQLNNIDGVSGDPAMSRMKIFDTQNIADYSGGVIEKVNEIKHFSNMPQVNQARIMLTDNYTLWGHINNSFIYTGATLGKDITVTLSNKQGGIGSKGERLPTPVGNIVEVMRGNGTADNFNLIIRNHDGNVLSTIATANVKEQFYFDGANWIKC